MRVVFWADNEPTMAQAMMLTLTSARSSKTDFSFGPRALERLMREGLTLTGDVPDSLMEALTGIPGLAGEFDLDLGADGPGRK